MRNLFLSATCVLFLSFSSSSQNIDSLRNIYNSQTIYRSGNKFIIGNQKLTFSDLKNKFTSPETRQLYFQSKKLSTAGTIFNLTSVGMAIYSTLSSHKKIVNIELASATGLLGILGILFHARAASFLDKAIWKENKETLFNITH